MKNLFRTLNQTTLTVLFICIATTFVNCQFAYEETNPNHNPLDLFQSLDMDYNIPTLRDNNPEGTTQLKEVSVETEIDLEALAAIELQTLKEDAISYYNQYDWVLARQSFHNYFEKAKTDDDEYLHIKYLYSNTCFNMEDYATALEVLDELNKSDDLDNTLEHDVKFDLAIITLMLNKESSMSLFTSIADDFNSPYHREAKTILERF